ncbi:hypothetical protein QUD72_15575, partial [Klebsiella pneumoniae]|nr:hypothetical protein [Klebsiella pneumoniae]
PATGETYPKSDLFNKAGFGIKNSSDAIISTASHGRVTIEIPHVIITSIVLVTGATKKVVKNEHPTTSNAIRSNLIFKIMLHVR